MPPYQKWPIPDSSANLSQTNDGQELGDTKIGFIDANGMMAHGTWSSESSQSLNEDLVFLEHLQRFPE